MQHVKQALSLAFAPLTEGGLGIERKDIWLTMKIPVQSINDINALLAEVRTDYFDLLLYHYPFSMFDSKAWLKQSWTYMTLLKQSQAVKRIGVSNFYASHLTNTGNQPCHPGAPFCAPGAPFYAPGSLSGDQGAPFCAPGAPIFAPGSLSVIFLYSY